MQKTKKRNRHTLFLICALSISLINFIVFWLYINVDTIASTFIKAPDGESIFYWYKLVIEDMFITRKDGFSDTFGNTMLAMVINLIIFPLALSTAYAFYKRVYGERFFRVVFYLPSIIAITTLAMSFRELFTFEVAEHIGEADKLGPLAAVLKLFGVNDNVLDPYSTSYFNTWIWPSIIFFGVFTGLGTNVVLMCGAMMRIPIEINEALRLDGCGFFKEMFKVSIPMIMPTITTWMIMIVTSVFGFSITPMLVAGLTPSNTWATKAGNKIMTIPLLIYINANQTESSVLPEFQAMGVMFSLVIMPIVFFARWLCEKLTPDISY